MATIAAVASIVNALIAASVWKQIRTPSGTHIGKQVESAHHTAIANNYRLQAMSGEFGLPASDRVTDEESKAHPPDER